MLVFPTCSGKISNPILRLGMTHISHFTASLSITHPRVQHGSLCLNYPLSATALGFRGLFPTSIQSSDQRKGTELPAPQRSSHSPYKPKSLSSSSQSRNAFPRLLLCPGISPNQHRGKPSTADGRELIISVMPGLSGTRAAGQVSVETQKPPGRMDGRGGGELLWLRKGKGLVERNAIKAPWRQNRVMERSVPFNNALFFLVQMKYLATSTGRVQLEVKDQTGGP